MTNEDAKAILLEIKNGALWKLNIQIAFDKAIKALENQCPSKGVDCENCPSNKPKSEWEQDHAILKAYSDGMNEVLDKIRAEMEEVYNDRPRSYNHTQRTELFCKVIEIIDEYKAGGKE